MTKAEMQDHRDQYIVMLEKAIKAESAGLYREAIDWAVSAWEHIDGMLQFERKYGELGENQLARIDVLDLVLRFAPALFEFESIDEMEQLLKSQRRIGKNTADDWTKKLEAARSQMWDSHRSWDALERQHLSNQEVSRQPRDFASASIQIWEKMGILHQNTGASGLQWEFVTQMDSPVFGKCPSCGATVRGPKSGLLNEVSCPKCSGKVTFVILARQK
jgi:hypothetical protein